MYYENLKQLWKPLKAIDIVINFWKLNAFQKNIYIYFKSFISKIGQNLLSEWQAFPNNINQKIWNQFYYHRFKIMFI